MPTWSNIMFQNSASPLMEQLIFFHDHTMMILTMITCIVMYMLLILVNNSFTNKMAMENQEIETIWTIIPTITLVFIALPSLRLLYLLDESNAPSLTLKTIGHQWYWSYEYPNFNSIEFDSFMEPKMTTNNQFRLLDTDSHTVLPLWTQARMILTSSDVIHSWALPSLGVKLDAIPGRLNQATFLPSRAGLFFGQCSEICGANHSFMPITLETVPPKTFIKWANTF